MFVDSDDACRPDRLARQLSVIHASGADGVFGRTQFVDEHDPPTSCAPQADVSIAGVLMVEENLAQNRVGGGTLFLKRSAFTSIGGFDETLRKSEDRDFALRFLKRFTLYGMDEVVIDSRVSLDGITLNPAPDSLAAILHRHRDLYSLPPAKQRAHPYRQAGSEYLDDEKPDKAAPLLFEALGLSPSSDHRRLCAASFARRPIRRFGVVFYGHFIKLVRRINLKS